MRKHHKQKTKRKSKSTKKRGGGLVEYVVNVPEGSKILKKLRSYPKMKRSAWNKASVMGSDQTALDRRVLAVKQHRLRRMNRRLRTGREAFGTDQPAIPSVNSIAWM